ncbi:Uncharacterised protein [Burkholderia pseudomallei]|nr:Uncharacterised protein [Burkholderia pseudomallei]VCE91921.1 Uncharacterised protein [Burkholderia pseudomallei]VCE95638.1 Uncharacterised protein [Burkholderia pseudomallei]VCF17476.1 Uncharacterised protein [Burkholderia pseudomallei]VCF31293.1 Uncharacterised protein [Burkholderia pseudomallei]
MTSGPGDAPRTAGPLVTRIVSRGGDMPALSRRKPTNARAHRAGRLRQARFSRVCFVRNAQSHRVARAVFSFLSHRPSAFGTERLSFVVCRLSSVVRRSSFVVRRSEHCALRCALCVVRRASRALRLASRVSRSIVCRPPSDIQHPTFIAPRAAFDIRHSTSNAQRQPAPSLTPRKNGLRYPQAVFRVPRIRTEAESASRIRPAASPRQAGWAAVPPSDDGRRAASCCA